MNAITFARRMRILLRLLRYSLILLVSGILLAGIGIGVAYWLIAPRLPSVESSGGTSRPQMKKAPEG